MKRITEGGNTALLGIVIFLLPGCATTEPIKEATGKAAPVITQSFASNMMRPGDQWRVYLKATDDDGNMKMVVAVVEQPGIGTYPVSLTRIPRNQQRELSGYLYLNTMGVQGLENLSLKITVQIQDRTGQISSPVTHFLSVHSDYRRGNPPEGVFQDQDIGPFLIELTGGRHGGN